MALQVLRLLRRINQGVALVAGVVLLLCVAFILTDVVLRQLGTSLGGTTEISGYVMAGVTAWGMAYALLESAHVRIDILRTRLAQPGRVFLDLLSMVALSATTIVIAYQSWAVVARTLTNNARANTPLETPLWIPQTIWWTGWLWFAVCSCILTLCAVLLFAGRKADEAERVVGTRSEAESLS